MNQILHQICISVFRECYCFPSFKKLTVELEVEVPSREVLVINKSVEKDDIENKSNLETSLDYNMPVRLVADEGNYTGVTPYISSVSKL